LHPGTGRSKLPNLVDPGAIADVEPAQDIELVIENSEATRQSVRVARRPGSSDGADGVRDRIIAEDATGLGLGGEVVTAYAVNVRCPRISEYAASHVVCRGVGVTG
jgi:hypothetical protein